MKALHLFMGLPSAMLGSAAVARNRVIAANVSISRFTVVLLGERIRTVIHCRRRKVFPHLVQFRNNFGNRKIRRAFVTHAMRLKSALEDFETNTLAAVSGLLRRLTYLGSLRDGKGTYGHWGLAKAHGDDAAQRALRASHRALLSEVLRKPLAALLTDVVTSCSSEHQTEGEFVATLAQSPPKPLPPAALAHLESVLGALSALVESRNNASLPGASPPPPPAPESRPPAGT